MSIRKTHPTDEEQFHTLWLKLREIMKTRRHLMHGDKTQAVIDAVTAKRDHPFLDQFAHALKSIEGQITPIIIRKAVMCQRVSEKALSGGCYIGKSLIGMQPYPYVCTPDSQPGEEEGPFTVLEVGDYCQLSDFMENLLGTKTVINDKGTNVWAKFLRSAGYVTSMSRLEQFAIDHLAGKESELCTERTNCFFVFGNEKEVLIAELIYHEEDVPYWELEANHLTNPHYIKDRGAKARVFLKGDHSVAHSFDAVSL